MQIRVYYEDTDCGNVVYYANYLKYMERSRTEYLRERGVDLADLREAGIQFAVIDVHVKYRVPAKYDDLLQVTSTLSDLSTLSVTFATTISRAAGQVCVQGSARLACINRAGRATKIPEEVREKLTRPAADIPAGNNQTDPS